MGSGIAQTAALAGIHTILYDAFPEIIEKSRVTIEKSLSVMETKGKISNEQKQDTLSRIRFVNDTNDCIADVIIEAIVEKLSVKTGLFNQLAEVNHAQTVFATNTSSLSVSEIAKGVLHPDRVVGMHFFNPAPIMKLVEVIRGEQTSEAAFNTVYELATAMGKTPVKCKDAPGFIVNHVARPFYLEALRLVETQNVPVEVIDTLIEASGFKMGPFKLMDLIGNDINYAVSCSVYEQLGNPARLEPSPIQQQKVQLGELGKKTGKGYYSY
ncbi:MAG: 3-hydroxybutyryl-CoA dehydrogenase [Chitinophagaceae bacterium]|nr:3-hydroxybutyryl-CoA dehydrogenase [Chitinophagaceae bacterium]